MTIHIVLLIIAIGSILFDMLMGLKRGFFPALIRFSVILLSAVFAYFFSGWLSATVMHTSITTDLGTFTVEETFITFLKSQEGVEEAFALSPVIEQIVFHLPEVISHEVSFLLIFIILRILTRPVTAVLGYLIFTRRWNRIDREAKQAKLASKKKKKVSAESTEEGLDPSPVKVPRARRFRSGGMLIGVAEAVVCISVLMVPIFGIVEFGEKFTAGFRNSDNAAIAEVAVQVDEQYIIPFDTDPVTVAMDAVGLRRLCLSAFHGLSHTNFVFGNGVTDVKYFEYLESMFPAVSALLSLQGMDPEHMTEKDYQNLTEIIVLAKDTKEVEDAVRTTVENTVTEFVSEKYKDTADVVVDTFVEKLFSEEVKGDEVRLKQEVEAIKEVLKVLETATSEEAEHPFEAMEGAEALLNKVTYSDLVYETLIEVADSEDKKGIIRQDINMTEAQTQRTADELNKYRQEKISELSPEERQKMIEATDALAAIFGVTLLPLQ